MDINKRYDGLKVKLGDRDEEMDLAKSYLEKSRNMGGLIEWVTVTDAKVVQSAPRSTDTDQLHNELKAAKVREIWMAFE